MRQKSQEDLQHLSIYVPKSLLRLVELKAEKERRSISSQVVMLIEKALEQEKTS